MRILVVDDEHAVREALVVLDVLMPGMNGLELCQLLRENGDRTPTEALRSV